jgi:hypothetical protein
MLYVLAMQRVVLSYHHFMLGVLELIILKRLVPKPKNRLIWRHERLSGYMEQHLLGDYTEKMFCTRIRLEYGTFNFLVNIVAPLFQK